MYKFWNITAAFLTTGFLLVTEISFIHPLSASPKYPQVSISDISKPVCYMQTANGRTLDLSSICGKVFAPHAPTALPTTSTQIEQIGPLEELQGGLDPNASVAPSCDDPEAATLCNPRE